MCNKIKQNKTKQPSTSLIIYHGAKRGDTNLQSSCTSLQRFARTSIKQNKLF